ncbi:MAG: molybdopterin-dependent oxidoreductase [Gemmatimonadetes bacterium]|nr:molybdopterin-dependent oxidoreductase [Gemmatimonadota bacterium]
MASPVEHAATKEPGYRVLDPVWFNAGPEPASLVAAPVTPVARFFARNHGVIPAGEPATWQVRVDGLVARPLAFTVAELMDGRFPVQTVAATLVCAGLRRTELMEHREVPGELGWGLEPVGTATWTGVRLADVLAGAGVEAGAAHVELTGADDVERHGRHFGFGGSIPLAKARAGEVLLAWGMNGEPLPPLHGGPLRLVVPGYIGARSVKWLAQVTLRATPSDNYFQRDAYRVLREPSVADPRSVRAGDELGEVPLNAVIVSPEPFARTSAGPLGGARLGHGARQRAPARRGAVGGPRRHLAARRARGGRGGLDLALLARHGGRDAGAPDGHRPGHGPGGARHAGVAGRGLEREGLRQQRLAPRGGGR